MRNDSLRKSKRLPTLVLVFLSLSVGVFQSGKLPVAHAVPCNTTITTDTFLASDVSTCAGGGITVGADSITLDCQGHKIIGVAGSQSVGIDLSYRTNATVRNCVLQDLFFGVLFDGTHLTRIINNTAVNNQFGFDAETSTLSDTLAFNTVSGSQTGMVLKGASRDSLYSNTAHDNIQGIQIGGNNDTITYNLAYNNIQGPYSGAGILVSGIGNMVANNTAYGQWAGFELGSSYNTLTSNISHDNTYGLFGQNSNHNTILSNRFDSNQKGVYLDTSANNTISSNEIHSNSGDGIRTYLAFYNNISSNYITENGIGLDIVTAGVNNNLIYNNYFQNSLNAIANSMNLWNTTKNIGPNIVGGPYLGGNFWSDFAGADRNGDGIGDSIFIPYDSFGNIAFGGDFLPLCPNNTCANNTAAFVKSFILDWADYDHNGVINIIDVANAALVYDTTSKYWDLNLNNLVDISDVATVTLHYDQRASRSAYPPGVMDPNWKLVCGSLTEPLQTYCMTRI